MKRILAIDAGTTSVRAAILNEDLQILAISSEVIKQYYPESGWVEHDPEEIWQKVLMVSRDVLLQLKLNAKEISGIGISNQRETTIVWERESGRAIYPAIVWQDRRTADFCRKLSEENLELLIQKKTGLLLDPYFSASKIRWILDHVEGAREKAKENKLAFGTVDCFLLWKLSGGKVHATDVTNASRSSLMNLKTRKWDKELLEIFEIPENILPEIFACDANFGKTEKSLFENEIPICGIAGDQQAAAVGQMLFTPGMIKSTYGTGCFVLLNTGKDLIFSKNKLLSTLAYQIGDIVDYALEGSIFNAGSVIQWLRDKAKLIQNSAETENLAQSVENTGAVVFVPAFTGLGAPYWQPDVRAAITGLSLESTKAHIVRAALESVVFQTEDLFRAIKEDYQKPLGILRVDGGMTVNSFLMQFLSDILNCEVQRSAHLESTVTGAAILAGLGCGIFSNLKSLKKTWRCEQEFTPKMSKPDRENLLSLWKKAVEVVGNSR